MFHTAESPDIKDDLTVTGDKQWKRSDSFRILPLMNVSQPPNSRVFQQCFVKKMKNFNVRAKSTMVVIKVM